MSRIGINGFGRTGRMVLRASIEKGAEIVAINDSCIKVEHMAYLFKFDSTHGRFKGNVTHEGTMLIVNGKSIVVFNESDPKQIKWSLAGADYIVEASGTITTVDMAILHLYGGALKVIIAGPSPDALLLICGVNLQKYNPKLTVVSCGSSTTNCLAPIAKVLNENFLIVEGLMTSVQATNSTLKTVDAASTKSLREGRSAVQNIIPTSSFAAKAIGKIIPDLNGKISGITLHVPIPNVSLVDFSVRLGKPTNFKEIKAKIKAESMGSLKGIIEYTEAPIVSSDCITNCHSAIFDANASVPLSDTFVKIVAWYDNEYGFACRVIDVINYMQSRG